MDIDKAVSILFQICRMNFGSWTNAKSLLRLRMDPRLQDKKYVLGGNTKDFFHIQARFKVALIGLFSQFTCYGEKRTQQLVVRILHSFQQKFQATISLLWEPNVNFILLAQYWTRGPKYYPLPQFSGNPEMVKKYFI